MLKAVAIKAVSGSRLKHFDVISAIVGWKPPWFFLSQILFNLTQTIIR